MSTHLRAIGEFERIVAEATGRSVGTSLPFRLGWDVGVGLQSLRQGADELQCVGVTVEGDGLLVDCYRGTKRELTGWATSSADAASAAVSWIESSDTRPWMRPPERDGPRPEVVLNWDGYLTARDNPVALGARRLLECLEASPLLSGTYAWSSMFTFAFSSRTGQPLNRSDAISGVTVTVPWLGNRDATRSVLRTQFLLAQVRRLADDERAALDARQLEHFGEEAERRVAAAGHLEAPHGIAYPDGTVEIAEWDEAARILLALAAEAGTGWARPATFWPATPPTRS